MRFRAFVLLTGWFLWSCNESTEGSDAVRDASSIEPGSVADAALWLDGSMPAPEDAGVRGDRPAPGERPTDRDGSANGPSSGDAGEIADAGGVRWSPDGSSGTDASRDVEDAMAPGDGEEAGAELEPGPGAYDPDFATSDEFFTLMAEPREGLPASPHGIVQIYYSENLRPVIEQQVFRAPVGSVAIKVQDRDGDGAFENTLVMIKREAGYNPDSGDWHYQQYGADQSRVQVESPAGALDFCGACHLRWPDTDTLAGTSLD